MFLKKIELRGFKSFADKTTIEFPAQHGGHVITGVVGPNGSGKSNVADSIRWVLGEQSVKMLRGKKAQDVIFAGTDKKARLSSAEVFLYLDNSDGKVDIDMSEIVIGRRLYRNGESEYLINSSNAIVKYIRYRARGVINSCIGFAFPRGFRYEVLRQRIVVRVGSYGSPIHLEQGIVDYQEDCLERQKLAAHLCAGCLLSRREPKKIELAIKTRRAS